MRGTSICEPRSRLKSLGEVSWLKFQLLRKGQEEKDSRDGRGGKTPIRGTDDEWMVLETSLMKTHVYKQRQPWGRLFTCFNNSSFQKGTPKPGNLSQIKGIQ